MTRLPDFMAGPLQRGLDVVPGIGQATIDKLAEPPLEIFTLDQLMGKFMSLDRDVALMVNWCANSRHIARTFDGVDHTGSRKTNSAAVTPRPPLMPLP